MALKLTETESQRLSVLMAGRGNRRGTGVFACGRRYKIIPSQILKVRQCLAAGMYYKTILNEPGLSNLSENIIKRTKRGEYDHLLEVK